MNKLRSINGLAIALPWPKTWCKQAGSWYDFLMERSGINKYNHYKVGHAAMILVNGQTGQCFYFDFGRYHAPFGLGRIRDEESDPDLTIRTRAKISGKHSIENILAELYHNPSCHGTGPVHSSYCKVDFRKAYSFVKKWQEESPLKYGPFIWNGTNCSRFVRSVILSGKPSVKYVLRLGLPLSITPTPKGNVNSLSSHNIYKETIRENRSGEPSFFISNGATIFLKTTLPPPERPVHLPERSQWLSGEGAGSWFHIKKQDKSYQVFRYSPEGNPECSNNVISLSGGYPDLSKSYEFIHTSNCTQVRLKQGNKTFRFYKPGIDYLC